MADSMKQAVSTLEGALLDAAVAKAEGLDFATAQPQTVRYSRDWQCGGQIIERERIEWVVESKDAPLGVVHQWQARVGDLWCCGPTPLIAAMRAYVTAKLGAEVDLP